MLTRICGDINPEFVEQRNPDGTFKAGSQLAHDLGAKGGHAAHEGQHDSGVSVQEGFARPVLT